MRSKSSRILVVVLSIVLWAQLVFTLGLTLWRYWAVYRQTSEIFVGLSPTKADPLIEAAGEYCNDAQLYYVGTSEADAFYLRYQFYPRKVTRTWIGRQAKLSQELLEERLPGIFDANGQEICLMVDRVETALDGLGTPLKINSRQLIYLLRD